MKITFSLHQREISLDIMGADCGQVYLDELIERKHH